MIRFDDVILQVRLVCMILSKYPASVTEQFFHPPFYSFIFPIEMFYFQRWKNEKEDFS